MKRRKHVLMAAAVVASTVFVAGPRPADAGRAACAAMNLSVVSNQTNNWWEAQAYADASTQDGHDTWRLVEITSSTENSCVVAAMRKAGVTLAWTGLTDYASEGTWVWTSGASLGSYTSWKTGEPNGASAENCVVVQKGAWSDANCDGGIKVLVMQWV